MASSAHAAMRAGRIRCRAVLFDWDGTLVDTLPLKVRHAGMVFSRLLHYDAGHVEAVYRRHSGLPRRALFDAIAEAIDGRPLEEEVYAQISREFSCCNQPLMDAAYVFADVPPALGALRRSGFTLLVSSSAIPEDVKRAVTETGLAQYFDDVLGSAKQFTKGQAHIGYVCQQWGLEPSQVCMVGDELADIRLAKAAGVPVVARAGTCDTETLLADGADRVIQELAELPELLVMDRRET